MLFNYSRNSRKRGCDQFSCSSSCYSRRRSSRKSHQAMKLNCPYRNKVRNKLQEPFIHAPCSYILLLCLLNAVLRNCYCVAPTITESTRRDSSLCMPCRFSPVLSHSVLQLQSGSWLTRTWWWFNWNLKHHQHRIELLRWIAIIFAQISCFLIK